MPDGKDSLVEPMESSCLHRPLDGPMGEAETPQLPDRNDPVLPVSQRG